MPKSNNSEEVSFASRVKTLRERNALTASDLAKLAGVSPAAVWNWEKNGTIPRPATVKMLADEFGVSADFLLRGSKETTETQSALLHVGSTQNMLSPRPLAGATLEDLIKAIEDKGFSIALQLRKSNRDAR
jgi:transcriptional regulator with XRE-family HTH domain